MALVIVWASWRATVVPGADFYGVAIILIPVLVAALALSTTGVAAFLSRPAMVYGGRISFSLYLVHVPLFETWTLLSGHVSWLGGRTALGSLLSSHLLPVAIVAAHFLYRYVEEPGRQWMRRVGPRPPATARREPDGVTGTDGGATEVVAVRHAAA
jgi:peptidoglycan/LPS O-acetylase OafA/YrhL